MRPRFLLAFAILSLSHVHAQTTETVTDLLGETVVEVITTDALGNLDTQTILTLTGTSTSTPTTDPALDPTTTTPVLDPTTTTPVLDPTTTPNQGPVGQPPTTTNTASETPFTYTTVIDGITTEVLATFTPSFATTAVFSPTSSGSIMAYSEWLSIYGATTSSTTGNAGTKVAVFSQGWWGVLVGAVTGVVGGVWFVLL